MSFVSAVENVGITAARNKIDRLLLSLPEAEHDALTSLLNNPSLSLEKIAKIIREEGKTGHEGVPADFYEVSASAVKRWRNAHGVVVNGL